MLSKQEFLKDSDLRREGVVVEDLGPVLMRELSVGERMDWRRKYTMQLDDAEVDDDERDTLLSLALVAVSLCEPNGSPMFGDDEIEEAVELLKGKSQRTVDTLQQAFLRISGLTDEAVEHAVGNSIEIPSEPSSSDSPGISDTPQPEQSQDN